MLARLAGISFLVFTCLLGVLGIVVLSTGAVVGWLLLASMIGVVTGVAAAKPAVRQTLGLRYAPARVGVLAVGVSFVVCVAVAGAVTLVGAAVGMPILAVFFAAGTGVWWHWRRRLPGVEDGDVPAARTGEPPPAARRPPGILDDLSTEELCIAWRRSYVRLVRANDESVRAQVVQSRRCLLDELERRDREGFARWLDSGARAASDPSRYLTTGG